MDDTFVAKISETQNGMKRNIIRHLVQRYIVSSVVYNTMSEGTSLVCWFFRISYFFLFFVWTLYCFLEG